MTTLQATARLKFGEIEAHLFDHKKSPLLFNLFLWEGKNEKEKFLNVV
jgi:hypothetical protein